MLNDKQFVGLDWLRFLAAFVVLLTHVRTSTFLQYSELEAESQNIVTLLFFAVTRLGHEAVIVFFVLSGYLVGGKAIQRIKNNTFAPKSYFIDRFSRIMTPLLPALALTSLVSVIVGESVPIEQVIGNLFSLQGFIVSPPSINGPLWSLSYESWFYILAGSVGIVACGHNSKAFGMLLLTMTMVVFSELDVTYLFCWLLGALAYQNKNQEFSALRFAISICVISVGTILSQLTSETQSFSFINSDYYLPSNSTCEIILASGIALLIRELCIFDKLSNTNKVGKLGILLASFSYTLYLVHYPLLVLMDHYLFNTSGTIDSKSLSEFIIKTTACLIASYALYWLFERNTNSVKKLLQLKQKPLIKA